MPLVHALEATGWSVFWDRTIPVGKTWRQVIGVQIESCRCMVVVWSKQSAESTWVHEEADEGARRGVLAPVLIDDILPPLGFRSIQAAQLAGWDGKTSSMEFRRLLDDLTSLLGTAPVELAAAQQRQAEEDAKRKAAQQKAEEEAKRKAAQQKAEAARERERVKQEAERQRQKTYIQTEAAGKRAPATDITDVSSKQRHPAFNMQVLIVVAGIVLVVLFVYISIHKSIPSNAKVRELLEKGKAAEAALHLTTPDDDNALLYYHEVLARDAGNVEARNGLKRIAERYITWAEQALAQRHFDKAADNLTKARSVDPDHPGLHQLEARLEAGIAAADMESRRKHEAETTPNTLDQPTARFGVTLGWQLARYEFIYDSPIPEARHAASSAKRDIEMMLRQDNFPDNVGGLNAQQLMSSILMYYVTKNPAKHSAILLGIAAMRASMIGSSANQNNNEKIRQIAYSAIQGIDSNIIPRKQELFTKILETKPANVNAVLELLYQMK